MKKICNSWGCTFRARIIPTVLYALISLVVTLSACTDDEHIVRQHAVPMQVSVVNSLTASRALIEDESLPGGARVGITLVDDSESTYDEKSYNNILYTSADGVKWTSENAPLLGAKQGKAVAYYPYNEDAADYTAIPVEAGTTDYMYSGWVEGLSKSHINAMFEMKHAMTGIRLNVKKSDSYKSEGLIEYVKIKSNGLAQTASLNITDGTFTDIKGGGNFMTISAESNFTEDIFSADWLAVPAGSEKEIEIECLIDGKIYRTIAEAPDVLTKGSLIVWNLLMSETGFLTQSVSVELWETTEETEEDLMVNNPYLIVTYNATSTSSATTLLYSTTNIAEMIVDGTSVPVSKAYTFSTTGEHEVKYRFTNEAVIPTSLCRSVKTLTKIKAFPSNLEEIGEQAFQECSNMVNMGRFPKNLKKIYKLAFDGCYNLTRNLLISELVTLVDVRAFGSCRKIVEVEVRSIDCLKGGAFYQCSGLKKVILPEGYSSLNSDVYNSSTYGLFDRCTGLTEINIPNSVTTIGQYTFQGCTGLKSIKIPESVTSIGKGAFSGCTGLINVTIPNSVTSIGEIAFSDCKNLVYIDLGEGVKTFGDRAFYQCTGLKEVVIPNSMSTIGYRAFQFCSGLEKITIPNSVKSIGGFAFGGCSGLTELNIPNSVTSIEEYAFHQCSAVERIYVDEANVNYDSRNNCNAIIETATNKLIQGCNNTNIPEEITSIGNYAFENCAKLTGTLTIPNSVTSIGTNAFKGCTGITGELVIPNSVQTIGGSAFEGCTGITGELIIPNSVTNLGGSAFSGCNGVETVTIGNLVTSIGDYAFRNCTRLTGELVLPNSVTSIGKYAFENCAKLTGTLTIPNSVTSIGEYAFQGCTGLTALELGTSLQTIGNYTFGNCVNLDVIISKATTAPTITAYTFNYCKADGTLIVPRGCIDKYSTWMSKSNNYLGKYNWSIGEDFVPTECLSLSITADDVLGSKTNTTIHYTAVCKGINGITGEEDTQTVTGSVQSDEFEPNPSTESSREVTVSYSYLGVTASTTITQAPYVAAFYSVDLNGQWQTSSVANPDATLYDGVYESFSNYNKNNTAAIMTVRLTGYTSFTIYIRSYAESSYDYVMASVLDKTINNNTSTSDASLIKAHTKGAQSSGTAISNYKAVTYEIPDDGEEHTITIVYRKDSSSHSGTDKGYLLIKKNN